MKNKRGPRRDREQFPYEAQVVGGKLMMPADLQRLHRFRLETEVIEAISDGMRAVVERIWPELEHFPSALNRRGFPTAVA